MYKCMSVLSLNNNFFERFNHNLIWSMPLTYFNFLFTDNIHWTQSIQDILSLQNFKHYFPLLC